MAKSLHQKAKLLYLAQIFRDDTDQSHPLNASELIDRLEEFDIHAERKSIYDDIKELNDFGMEIKLSKSKKNGGYFLASRDFELPELKLLVDVIAASRFLPQKKSEELIHKCEKLAGKYGEKELKRQVFVEKRVKTENETIYYNVDLLHKAMGQNKPVQFIYTDYTIEKELVPRKNGALYQVSPWALTVKDDNYYLVAYAEETQRIQHYRVDKMKQIQLVTGKKREGIETFRQFDVASYANRQFGMFAGADTDVTLVFPLHLTGVVIDRFGRDIFLRKLDEAYGQARVKVALSQQFYGWITGIGGELMIKEPEAVRLEYEAYLNYILESYKKGNEGK